MHGAHPHTASVVWLFTSQEYGIVRIYVTCARQPRPYSVFLLEFEKEGGYWIITRSDIVDNLDTASSPTASAPSSTSSIPAWLDLPPDTYSEVNFRGSFRDPLPRTRVIAWYSSSRTYALGHVANQVTRPADATTVRVNGDMGWATQANGYVTITIPLTDGTTVFFSGDGLLEQVEPLAASALAHIDTELQPLTKS